MEALERLGKSAREKEYDETWVLSLQHMSPEEVCTINMHRCVSVASCWHGLKRFGLEASFDTASLYTPPVSPTSKIDLTNDVQREVLHRAFAKNMHTINFWLEQCVFPRDTAVG